MDAKVPKKVSERLARTVGTYQRILKDALNRDVNESDTVTIVKDMLADVFGFDKYTEVTSEFAIRGTYCDLAVTLQDTIQYLIEVKAIGLTLKENHLRQAVGYGATQGIPWVVLTNGVQWEIYAIKFEKPIGQELVFHIDLLELSPRKKDHQALLFLLCKEGIGKDAIKEFHERSQTVNRFVLAALVQSEPVLALLRRELKRLAPDARADLDEIKLLLGDVLKRDVLEGEAATKARRQVQRAAQKPLRQRGKEKGGDSGTEATPNPK